jgi:rare lipoprotein A
VRGQEASFEQAAATPSLTLPPQGGGDVAKRLAYLAISFAFLFILTACGGPPSHKHYPKPPFKGVKIGKPYKIRGKWYTPRYQPDYDETGVASWYGPNFHGKPTANGERYNQYGYTAAHTTLPLPSIVRVTNLTNGRAMNLRVNDRGPFHNNRIIDLSKAAAKKLGVIGKGIAKVRVQYLPQETARYVATKGREGDALAYSEGFKEYYITQETVKNKPIIQDIKSLPMESQGVKISAPTKAIEVATLPELNEVVLPTSRGDDWLIQVASYADTINAEQMMKRLLPFGQPLMQEVGVRGRSYYRVLLKPLRADKTANELLTTLRQKFAIHDAKVVRQ